MQLEKWTKASNYIGQDFSGYYVGLSRGRDSDVLTQSNFEAALERLGGESETVVVARSSHWACGWVEEILIHQTDVKALAELKAIAKDLERYPVLDEDDFYEREADEMRSTFESYSSEFIEGAIKALKAKTDVPHDILESLVSSEAFISIVEEAYRDDCGYRGIEDGFITEANFVRAFLACYGGHYANADLNMMHAAIEAALGVA